MIYFAQDSQTYHIKIGWTDGDVEKRVASLQTGNPHSIKLLLAVPATREMEPALHRIFSKTRACGEWFHPSFDLLHLIVQLAGILAEYNTFVSICRSQDPDGDSVQALRQMYSHRLVDIINDLGGQQFIVPPHRLVEVRDDSDTETF